MKTYVYRGGLSIVEKSGVGKAIEHQEKMLNAMHASHADRWKDATVVHMNTFHNGRFQEFLYRFKSCSTAF